MHTSRLETHLLRLAQWSNAATARLPTPDDLTPDEMALLEDNMTDRPPRATP